MACEPHPACQVSIEIMASILTAVLTGNHAFDETSFTAALRSLNSIECQVQPLDTFVSQSSLARQKFDVVVFFNYHQDTPDERTQEVLSALSLTGQGIAVLHHGLVAFPHWPWWNALCGIPDRTFSTQKRQSVHYEIYQADHPITRGLKAWDMLDETYAMESAKDGNEILLTTDHPASLSTIAWTRQNQQARVFCYQSGHDRPAYDHPGFRAVLERGVQWAAGRI